MNETNETQGMPFTGEIEGGGGYVAAAWGISLIVLLAYVAMVTFRLRRLENRKQ